MWRKMIIQLLCVCVNVRLCVCARAWASVIYSRTFAHRHPYHVHSLSFKICSNPTQAEYYSIFVCYFFLCTTNYHLEEVKGVRHFLTSGVLFVPSIKTCFYGRGVALACGMFLNALSQSLCANMYYFITLRMGTRVRATVIALLYLFYSA